MKYVELTAVVVRECHRFTNAESDCVIAKVAYGEGETTVKAYADSGEEFCKGQAYRFWGRWGEYRGEAQFIAKSWVESEPIGEFAICEFLQQCKGCGAVASRRLWSAFGENCLDRILHDDPAEVSDKSGISVKLAENLKELLRRKAGSYKCEAEIHDLLSKRGFPRRLKREVLDRWGNRAAQIIKQNPYRLMQFQGVGFKRADSLWLELGLPTDSLRRQAMCMTYGIQQIGGSTWHHVSVARNELEKSITNAELNFDRALELCRRGKLLASRWTNLDGQLDIDGDRQYLAIREHAVNENVIAKSLNSLARDVGWPIDTSKLTPHQAGKAGRISRARIGILCGSPGTGKTYVAANAFIAAAISQFGIDHVMIGAPTGKAAVRITESLNAAGIKIRAKTWHSHLFSDDPWPSFLVSDESSMIDTDLMAAVFARLRPDQRLLLVGDTNQLPPVGHGAPLRDMIAAGVPCAELTEIRRNSGEIVMACANIRHGVPTTVPRQFQYGTQWNLGCLPASPEHVPYAILSQVRLAESYGIHPVWDVQVLSPTKKNTGLGGAKLNQIMQAELNPNPLRAGVRYKIDDKVICTKNGRYRSVGSLEDAEGYSFPDGNVYVANGEIGRVVRAEAGFCQVLLDAPTREVLVTRSEDEDGNDTSNWSLAYCVTAHKSQGSEWPLVIVVLDEAAQRMCDRAWLYTAISRAKKLCILVGNPDLIPSMCRTAAIDRRLTFLSQLIGVNNDSK